MPQPDPDTGELERTTFAAFLSGHRNGVLDDELAAGLREVIEAVRYFDKSGSLTLKIAVDATGEGVTISHDLTVRPPKAPPVGSFYFAGDDGMPSRRDPNQPQIPGTED